MITCMHRCVCVRLFVCDCVRVCVCVFVYNILNCQYICGVFKYYMKTPIYEKKLNWLKISGHKLNWLNNSCHIDIIIMLCFPIFVNLLHFK